MKSIISIAASFITLAVVFGLETRADETVTITVTDQVTHSMAGGVGASWHSILQTPAFHGGSAYGGCPPVTAKNEPLWKSLEQQADWLGLKFIRAEMDWRQWQPQPGRYTWDSPEMKILDRILAWAQKHDADVMLQCMWHNVDWLAFPQYRGNPDSVGNSAPADLDAFAKGWVTLLHELRDNRGYTCIRWINLVNEPNTGWWWRIPDGRGGRKNETQKRIYLASAMAKVRAALQAAKIPVKIMGPDFTGPPDIKKLSREPWFSQVDDVDFHSYKSRFDWEDLKLVVVDASYPLGQLDRLLQRYRAQTSAAGKGLFLTEFGTQTYGYEGNAPQPGSFRASLKDTQLLIRAMNLGIDGANHWSFVNRGDLDGQWQLVDTWNPGNKSWLDQARPHSDAYYILGLAIRHLPQRAKVLTTTIQGGKIQEHQRIWATSVRSPKDNSLTLLIVNDADQPWTIRLALNAMKVNNLSCLRSIQDQDHSRSLVYQDLALHQGNAEFHLEPFSLMILTDKPLDPKGPGRF